MDKVSGGESAGPGNRTGEASHVGETGRGANEAGKKQGAEHRRPEWVTGCWEKDERRMGSVPGRGRKRGQGAPATGQKCKAPSWRVGTAAGRTRLAAERATATRWQWCAQRAAGRDGRRRAAGEARSRPPRRRALTRGWAAPTGGARHAPLGLRRTRQWGCAAAVDRPPESPVALSVASQAPLPVCCTGQRVGGGSRRRHGSSTAPTPTGLPPRPPRARSTPHLCRLVARGGWVTPTGMHWWPPGWQPGWPAWLLYRR